MKFHLPRKHSLKYLQGRSFIFSCLKNSAQLPPVSLLETFSTQDCLSKGQITQLYNILGNHKESAENKRQAWIYDLNKDVLKSTNHEYSVETLTIQLDNENLYYPCKIK